MAVGYSSPAFGDYLRLYRVETNTDTFTHLWGVTGPDLPPSGGAADIITALAFHPSGKYLVVASNTGGTGRLSYYTRNGDVFNVTADGVAAPLGVTVNKITFSPDGEFMAVGLAASPFLRVYGVNAASGVFTALASFATMPTTAVSSVSFDRKSRYLVVGQAAATASLVVYRVGTSSYTLIDNTSTAGTTVQSVMFSPRQSMLVVGEDQADPARMATYVPIAEHFPLPATNLLPTQPVASRAAGIAMRHRGYIY
jgi:WD40 repeat protein